jgi:hypothetical protein
MTELGPPTLSPLVKAVLLTLLIPVWYPVMLVYFAAMFVFMLGILAVILPFAPIVLLFPKEDEEEA